MQAINFEEVLEKMLGHDPRYPRDAYIFVREALDYTQKLVCKANKNEIRHITGQELLEGIREYALFQYGPMAITLLAEWGIHRGEDFGEIVFNMVDHRLLNKTDADSRDDFKNGYTFEEAFRKPFLPSAKLETPRRASSPTPKPASELE
jgi:uncharacterized repeat protein (TIGR04138 family)